MSASFMTLFEYLDSDYLIRKIRVKNISDRGKVSAAAFVSNNGVSVTRVNKETVKEAIRYMNKILEGKNGVMLCVEAELYVYIEHSPSTQNINHFNLWRNENREPLTKIQRTQLAALTKILD